MKIRSVEPGAPLSRSIRNARAVIPLLCLSAAFPLAQADIIEFDLSPSGEDVAVGLSPANEVPAATGTGSGNEISGGITFDTESSTLSVAIGYGSSTGFTDLTAPPTGMHIHGPAAPGETAGVLYNLAPIHFPSTDPNTGGIVYGSVVYQESEVADLLAGLNYVNIHTLENGSGEIRGQLIPLLNVAPELICPASSVVECAVPVTYEATVTDADGDAVQVIWSVNGEVVQTDDIEAGGPPTAALLAYTSALPLGENTLALTATDVFGNVATCSTTITVVDTTPPVIEELSVNSKMLWPPNHKMKRVAVRAEVTDACGPATWQIVSISSNEAVDAPGSGNTAPDWEVLSESTAMLRAERSGNNKEGRVYTITVRAEDASGNLSDPSTVTVTVPHSKVKKVKVKSKRKMR